MHVVLLPDEALQQRGMVGKPVENFRGRQAEACELGQEIRDPPWRYLDRPTRTAQTCRIAGPAILGLPRSHSHRRLAILGLRLTSSAVLCCIGPSFAGGLTLRSGEAPDHRNEASHGPVPVLQISNVRSCLPPLPFRHEPDERAATPSSKAPTAPTVTAAQIICSVRETRRLARAAAKRSVSTLALTLLTAAQI